MDAESLSKFLEDNSAEIAEAIKRKVITRITEDYRWEIGGKVTETVNKFVDDEIVPAVRAELESRKGALVEGAVKAIAGISDKLAEGLAAKAAKQIGDDWQLRGVIKALFGV